MDLPAIVAVAELGSVQQASDIGSELDLGAEEDSYTVDHSQCRLHFEVGGKRLVVGWYQAVAIRVRLDC